MKRHLLAIGVAVVLVASLLTAWVMWQGRGEDEQPVSVVEQPGEVGTFSIYTNGEYGFSVMYPSEALLDEVFDPLYRLPSVWRVNALPNETGTPVLNIVTYDTKSEDSYPRYFITQVRIGVSDDPEEVARCEKQASEQGESQLEDVDLNGTTFKAFSFQDAGMMQYVKGVSYRAVHEGRCVAIEKLQIGSSYRDQPSEKDIPDESLQAEYADLDMIIRSFSFARP